MLRRIRVGPVIVAVTVVSGSLSSRINAQAPLTFDVASVKERQEFARAQYFVRRQSGQLLVVALPARNLVNLAYPTSDHVAGGPDWFGVTQFEIDARFDPKVLREHKWSLAEEGPWGVPPPVAEMMRALLAHRFKLKVHFADRDVPIRALVAARKDGRPGADLRPTMADCSGPLQFPPKCGVKIVGANAEGTGATIADLIGVLTTASPADPPIRDFTGLDGRFDFIVSLGGAIGALEKRFGLKLESRKGRERTVVVDYIERPSAN